MKFISIFTHEATNPAPPTEEEIAVMGKLIEEGMKAGWLIATEGVSFGEVGVKVHKGDGGEITVVDGPFTEAKEVIGGYALLQGQLEGRGRRAHPPLPEGRPTWEGDV